jgi:RNA polymerase sigma-70 factor, ECF subfamily
MAGDSANDVTALLQAWRLGSPGAEEQLINAVNLELRRIAARYLRRERIGHTLEPIALVNEAYLRLVGQQKLEWQNRGHFLAIASREMRRILVDYARKRRAAKREGFAGERVSLTGLPDPSAEKEIDLLSLHEAMSHLAHLDARQAQFIELRYFGGLTIDEIAAFAGVSAATVKRQLTEATLWLRLRLQRMSST